ncbi:MAG: FG-GAP repeat protein [Acidobacteriota bacterium]
MSRLAVSCLVLVSPAVPLEAQLVVEEAYLLDLGAEATEDELFGETSVTGDFDADGFDDLVVGVPSATVDGFVEAGRVDVFFGGPGGLQNAPSVSLTQGQATPGTACRLSEDLDRFGDTLAVGDFDADSFDDLVVGIPSEEVAIGGQVYEDLGAVAVFWGRADRTFAPGPCLVYTEGVLPGLLGSFSRFGSGLAVGDFEGDGYPDLAIGAPGADVDARPAAGTVTVVYSRAGAPLDVTTSQLWHQNVAGVVGESDAGDRLGSALATGDLVTGGDTACDLAIGVPNQSVDAFRDGAVMVLFGCTETGLSSADSVQYTAASFGRVGQANEQMGLELAIGNFDCDTAEDLAIGAPGSSGMFFRTGEVRMIYGDQTTAPRLDVFTAEEAGGGGSSFSRFGSSMTAADLGGTCDDLLVASPGIGSASFFNRVFSLPGIPGVGIDPSAATRHAVDAVSNWFSLGYSLSNGRFDGDRRWIAAGAPGLEVGGLQMAGRVWMLPSGRIFADGFEDGDTSAWIVGR